MNIKREYTGLEIAVIGMAGRFPGAENLKAFWNNLLAGKESISFFSDEELIAGGVTQELLSNPNYVKAKGLFPRLEYFDADFFNYTPRDASLLDPQVRALHEEVYHALEDAGYAAEDSRETTGLFLGATGNLAWELDTIKATVEGGGHEFATIQLNDKDFAATRIAYSLNLQGPSVVVHSACSTSLYAVDVACRHILTGACSLAVAGGSGLTLPHRNGYLYQDGMINSPDGHCRPFDQEARGTVEGNGLGVVVLKRLEEAIRDRDHIYAIIRGTAANNDGNRKVGFTAPSVEGQAEVIRRSLIMAGVSAESISYVETHGTGTNIGDPIEVAALKKAWQNVDKRSCGIGSLKSNIGHLDVAAGISSLIKTSLALKQEEIPASINYEKGNLEIDIDNSPFYVVTETKRWERKRISNLSNAYAPLRAGISSFGIGGTNVHMILEEAPERSASGKGREWKLFCLSAHTDTALRRLKESYLAYLTGEGRSVDPSDLAWSLQTRQKNMPKRFALPYRDMNDLIAGLTASLHEENGAGKHYSAMSERNPNVYFLFSGQGSQYRGMAQKLYETEPVFRRELDACLAFVEAEGNKELRHVLLKGEDQRREGQHQAGLQETGLSQIALFVVEYSLARLLMSWGIDPAGMIGHSLGEYTAACVAGVFTLEEGIKLVLARGSVMQAMPRGSMLGVHASSETVEPLLTRDLSLAAINSPTHCTVSGSDEAIQAFEQRLAARGLASTKLQTSHAFHSALMEGAMEPFKGVFSGVKLKEPQIPYVSNVTGDWISSQDATDASYYAKHLRGCVNFAAGIKKILADERAVLIEVGPGRTLATFARQADATKPLAVVNTLRHPKETASDDTYLVARLGELWGNNVALNWKAYYKGQVRNRVPLPLYPFEPKKFPLGSGGIAQLLEVGTDAKALVAATQEMTTHDSETMGTTQLEAGQIDWDPAFLPPKDRTEQHRTCLVLTDQVDAVSSLTEHLSRWRFYSVQNGDSYLYKGTLGATVRCGNALHMRLLLRDLYEQALLPNTVIVSYTTAKQTEEGLRALIHALTAELKEALPEVVVLSPVSPVSDMPHLVTQVRGLGLANPNLPIRLLDAGTPLGSEGAGEKWATVLKHELVDRAFRYPAVAYVGNRRQVLRFKPLDVEQLSPASPLQRSRFVFLSREDQLPMSLALPRNLVKNLEAEVTVLPYRLQPEVPVPDNVFAELQGEQEKYISRYGVQNLSKVHDLVDEYATRLIYDYIHPVFPLKPGKTFIREEMSRSLGVISSLERYVDYFLHMLCEDGLLEKAGDECYRVTDRVQSLRRSAIIRGDVERTTTLFSGQLDLLEHCVDNFGSALRGDVPSLAVLYPGGKEDLLRESYVGSIQEKEDDLIKEIFSTMLAKITSTNRKIRILEAGGGYGAILRKVAPLLKGLDVDYYFTDVGNSYIEEFQQYALEEGLDFLHFGLFDITKEPEAQGLDAASFDIVFAYNVVHATERLSISLSNMQRLLKPGALLCVLERTKARRYVDLIWGLADGWWHFDQDERELSPLVSKEQWEGQFRALGLEKVTVYPDHPELRECMDVGIVIGRMPLSRHTAGNKTVREGEKGIRLLPTVEATDASSLEPALNKALSDVRYADGIVAWDDLESKENSFRFRSLVPLIPESVEIANSVNRAVGRHAASWDKPAVVISTLPHTDEWGESETEWAIVHDKLDADADTYRIYVSGDDPNIDAIPSVLDAMLTSGMKRVAIRSGRHPFLSVAPSKPLLPEEGGISSELEKTESVLKKVWSKLLGREVDVDADFFELGGDSFKLIQMTVDLEREGHKVLMNEVYKYPTIRSLARYLNEAGQQNSTDMLTAADIEDKLHDEAGTKCRLCVVDDGNEQKNVLFVDVDKEASGVAKIRQRLKSMQLPEKFFPHYVLPLSLANSPSDRMNMDQLVALGALSDCEKGILEDLDKRLSIAQNAFNRAIVRQPVSQCYGLSNIQKTHFRGNVRLQLYFIEFHENVDEELLERAFCDVVGSHGLLRSCLYKQTGEYRWKEFAPPQKTPLPRLDLSRLTPAAQSRVMDFLARRESEADFKVEGVPMYHVTLIKLNERHYNLFFQFDHSIFDVSSGQVIRRQLFQRYKDLQQGSRRAMEVSTSYRDYLKQIHQGPIGITAEELIARFNLPQYTAYNKIVSEKIDQRPLGRIQQIRSSVDLSRFNFDKNDQDGPFEVALQIYILVISRLLELDTVPFDLLFQNRRYENKNFADVVGLVLDSVPFVVPVNREEPSRMTAVIRENIQLINDHNINFLNMAWDDSSRVRWEKVTEARNTSATFYSPFLLNYAGNAELEYDKIWDYSMEQLDDDGQARLNYADFYGLVKVRNNKLDFLILCKFEPQMERIRQLFDEEMAHLIKMQVKKRAVRGNV